MNKKAFTLIELLAVIIILGLLLAISIPSITRYLAQSRKKVYINTLDSYVGGATKMMANGELPSMDDQNTAYYIPFNCIPTEKSMGSPNGDWQFAYVIVTNDGPKRSYYVYAKDVKNIGVAGINVDKLKMSDITEIEQTKDDYIGVGGKTTLSITPDTCNYPSAVTKNLPKQPADSCFMIDPMTGNLYGWKLTAKDSSDPCYSNQLIVPSTVDGVTVNEIGATVFYGSELISVTIPSTVKRINMGAFSQNKLTNVTIPAGVTFIGDSAFQYNQMNSLSLPSSLTMIDTNAFMYNQLTSLTLPNNLVTLGSGAFYMNKLTSVTLPASLTVLDTNVFAQNQITSINIPSTVTSIGMSAFDTNKLTSVTIPANTKTINTRAFRNNLITSLNLSSGVQTIGMFAFETNKLASVTIPLSVTKIDGAAFTANPLGNITLQGRSSTTGMTLSSGWNGTGTIVYAP